MIKVRAKRIIYWIGYAVILLTGIYLSTNRIVPIQTPLIFLLGLVWIWTGCTIIFKTNPYYAQKYMRKHQIIMAVTSLGMGISWVIISLTPLSKQGIPMIIVSIPFVLIDWWVYLHKTGSSK